MTTWLEIVDLVLRDSGVVGTGQTPSAQMQNDAKRRMNMMIGQWKRKRWLVYHLIDISTPCDGSLFYTLGAGQTFNVPRTDQLQAAFARQTNVSNPSGRVDFPLQLIHSYEDYSTITLKNMSAGPAYYVFYDSGYPVAKVYPWPLMNSGYELHLIIKAELDSIGELTDTIVLPPEYEEALYQVSMQRTRAAFFLPPDATIDRNAKAALATLRAANFQVPTMTMPSAVTPRNGSTYNIFSDSYGPTGR